MKDFKEKANLIRVKPIKVIRRMCGFFIVLRPNQEKMSIKKLASETAWYGLSSIVGRFLNVLLVPIYTNLLSPAEYGVVTDLYATFAFLMVILSFQMVSAFFRYGTAENDRQNAFSTGTFFLIFFTFSIAGLALIFAPTIAGWMNYPQHAEYIRYFALILAFDALAELPFGKLRLENRPRRFAFTKLFNISINIGLNLFWLVFCPFAKKQGWVWIENFWSPTVGVGYIFLANLIASAATLVVLMPQFLAAFRGVFDKILWKKMVVYAAPLVVVGFAGIVNEMLDRAIMKYILPGTPEENSAQLGIYGANYKLAMLITLFTQAYRYAAEPFFFKNAASENALENHAEATKWFTVAAAGGMLGILCFLDWVKYFLGENFHEGLHIVPILLLANVLLGIYYNFSVWYRLKDKTMTGAWISLGGAAITLVLNLWWVPKIGYDGAAWATLVCYFFMSWTTWQVGKKHYPVVYPFGKMLFYVGLALGLGMLSLFLKRYFLEMPFVFLGLNVGIFLSYLGVVFWKK